MTNQMSFSAVEFTTKKKITRREKFLARMEKIVPWERLVALLEPYYPKGTRGRPPVGLERMLRVYFLQQWYGLADEALEDAIYDSQSMRAFAGIDLSGGGVPDATTVLKFRRLLEAHDLTAGILREINASLQTENCVMKEGVILDATIIDAPSSTKNSSGQRDPEMHQTKKGNQWYFGMKAHVAVDARTGLVKKVRATAANVSDINQAAELLEGEEEAVFADAGYQGLEKRPEIQAKCGAGTTFYIARKPSALKKLTKEQGQATLLQIEKLKAQVRSLVEHPFQVIKRLFRYERVRYRGLAKNLAHLNTLFALANLVLAGRKLTCAC
jgi:IS5 family transposase